MILQMKKENHSSHDNNEYTWKKTTYKVSQDTM